MNAKDAALLDFLGRLPMGVAVCDITTGEILWVNGTHTRISGASSPDRLVGRSLFEFLSPEQLAVAIRDVEAVAKGDSPPPVVYHVRKIDGGTADVQIASTTAMLGKRPVMVSMIADVTESERAIADLRRSEARYRYLLEESPAAIMIVLREQIVFANKALAAMIGAPDFHALSGVPAARFFTTDARARIREVRAPLVAEKSERSVPVEVEMLRVDGASESVRVMVSVLDWEGESATRIVAPVWRPAE